MATNDMTDEQRAKDAGAAELPDGALEGVSGGGSHYLQGDGWKCPRCGSQTVEYTAHMFSCDTCGWGASVWPK